MWYKFKKRVAIHIISVISLAPYGVIVKESISFETHGGGQLWSQDLKKCLSIRLLPLVFTIASVNINGFPWYFFGRKLMSKGMVSLTNKILKILPVAGNLTPGIVFFSDITSSSCTYMCQVIVKSHCWK